MLKLKKLLLATLLSSATLFAGFTTVDCTNQTHLDTLKLPQIECEVLEAFWTAMGSGVGWTDKTGWDTVTYADTWSGVYMHDDNSSIKWFGWPAGGNALSGQLPQEIGNFMNLEQLGLGDNSIIGELPSSIDNLHSLELLLFTGNQLSGALPKLSLFSSLYALRLNDNQFTGSIPSSYSNFTTLTDLNVQNNQLTGSIPDLSQLPVLEDFRIQENNFTFSDIEPQIDYIKDISHPSNVNSVLHYKNQAPINESTHPIVYFDDTLSIIPSLAINPSANDYYIWKKDDVVIEGTDGSRIYTKTSATTADAGCYSYDVNNSKVTLPDGNGIFRNLVLQSSTCIQAVYENAPTIQNPNPPLTVAENQTYTYTSAISDVDNDDLTVSILPHPTWLTFASDGSHFTLTGTPSYTNAGTYDINITVTDGKIPVHKNYVLTVTENIPTGYTAGDNSYTHDATGSSIAIGSPYYYSFPEVDDTNNIELYSRSSAWRNVYEGLTPEGILTTGYFNNDKNTTKTPTLSTPYPLGSKATLLEEPSRTDRQPMIMVEIPLGNGSITIGE